MGSITMLVDLNRNGNWEVELSDDQRAIECETLEQALRVAYLYAYRQGVCDLVVRGMQHRVLHPELVDDDHPLWPTGCASDTIALAPPRSS